ncbi:Cell division cycle 5-like protein [Coccomyxa sp. Obi]|nr:Cell division cycle 5-like protein [Coccomyxa sp. Obi]
MIKGGVWKNTEDEILKAAVMKYGLNQWARISSLLVRKSAKQCKARWYEWLDPAIKKTEWTREEDEKLLHLAKLMPTQWRTIAPIVGRTPAQCLERYEKLLDAAAAKDDNYDPADDPRRLRPGEIDPNPEAKPARPDPIDMDEDEKEMLSEARARLANTRGKKAKRKARERQLEEARRLASLQKKRELRAAGIEMKEKARRRRGIDYNREVAFEKAPAAGFFDTGSEKDRTREIGKEFRPATLEEMEGRRRKDIEANLMKSDEQKAKLKEAHNQPAAVAKAMELNDASAMRRRGRMMLPAPQISEEELEAIAKGGGEVAMDVDMDGAGGEATRRLLGNYQTPARMATPMRTPRAVTASGQDRVMMEAQNLSRLQQGQTPLYGGENPQLFDSDFSGITPKPFTAATPNPLAAGLTPRAGATPALPHPGATPSAGRAIAGVSATPSVAGTPLRGGQPGGGPGMTPMRTPIRDELGLNDPDMLLPAEASRREARAREAMEKNSLRAGLAGLPAPTNEYQIVVPELPEDKDDGDVAMEEDAADVAARRKAAAKAKEEAELRKRSQVLQRGLPRPLSLDHGPEVRSSEEAGKLSQREAAEALLFSEMKALLQHDAAKHPVKESKKDKKKRPRPEPQPAEPLEEVAEEDMAAALQLLQSETAHVRRAMGHEKVSEEDYMDTWASITREFIYLPSRQRYDRSISATNSDRLASMQGEHEAVRSEMEKEAMRAAKLEQRLAVLTKGYVMREAALRKDIEGTWQAVQTAEQELACFRALAQREAVAMPERKAAVKARLAAQEAREQQLQKRFKVLHSDLADASKAVAAA